MGAIHDLAPCGALGLKSDEHDVRPGAPQMVVSLRPERLKEFGFRPMEVLSAIQTAYQGTVVGQVYDNERVFEVAVILEPGERRTLVVGRGISLQGTVADAERLVVEGTVESQMIQASELFVAQAGVFRGEVQVEDAEIAGLAGASAVIEAVGVTPTVKQSLFAVRDGGHVTWIGNSAPQVEVAMQQIVTRELTVHGAYGFNQEFAQSIEAIRSGRVDPTVLIEQRARLEDASAGAMR